MPRQIMLGVLALALIGSLGATAAKDIAPRHDPGDNVFWIKTDLSDDLLASRLNVTNAVKLPVVKAVAVPATDARTAQLIP